MEFVCFRLKRVIQTTTTIIYRHKILRYRLESNERATARGVSFVSTIGPGRTTTCVWRYLYGTTLWPLVYIQRVVQQSLTTLSTKSCVCVVEFHRHDNATIVVSCKTMRKQQDYICGHGRIYYHSPKNAVLFSF